MENKPFDSIIVQIKEQEVKLNFFAIEESFSDCIFLLPEVPIYDMFKREILPVYRILQNYVSDSVSDYHQKLDMIKIINPTDELQKLRKRQLKEYRNNIFNDIKDGMKKLEEIEVNLGFPRIDFLDVDSDGNILIDSEKTEDIKEIANAIRRVKYLKIKNE